MKLLGLPRMQKRRVLLWPWTPCGGWLAAGGLLLLMEAQARVRLVPSIESALGAGLMAPIKDADSHPQGLADGAAELDIRGWWDGSCQGWRPIAILNCSHWAPFYMAVPAAGVL